MSSNQIILHRTAERPDLKLWLLDDDGTLVNLSTGFTFVLKLGSPGTAATFTKTTNIFGAAGSGVEPTGTANVTIAFSAAELDSLTAGHYTGQLVATTSNLDRLWQFRVQVRDVIT